MATGKHGAHCRELTDLLRSMLADYARDETLREATEATWAERLRRFLKRQFIRGVPLHRQVMDLHEWPDDLVLLEARFWVIAAPWLGAWHGDAKAYVRVGTRDGREQGHEGTFSLNVWLGGVPT